MTMNDEEIKKALECFSCTEDGLHENALDLINRQQAELERLQKELASKCLEDSLLEREKAEDILVFADDLKRVKSEAIKEFAERLKKEAVTKCDWDNCVDVEDIDRLVAEMVGGENA